MLPLWNFGVLAFTSLFTVINPISAAPIFVGMTSGSAPGERRRAALKSSLAAGATLLLFEAAGGLIFSLFGITVPAFQIAGGVLFTMISIRTLNNGREEVEAEAAAGGDPTIVPLAIPTIAGPGAISTVMALVGQAPNYRHRVALAAAIGAAIAITWLVLLAAPWIVEKIGQTGQRIVAKIMGLITCVIGVQFVINGITPVLAGIIKSSR